MGWNREVGSKRRVLVAGGTQELGGVLERSGYAVEHAVDGRDPLAAMLRETPDLLLLDLSTPLNHVAEFQQQKAANPRWAHMPLVVSVSHRVMELPISDASVVLYAPSSAAEMLAVVRRYAGGPVIEYFEDDDNTEPNARAPIHIEDDSGPR